jgi:hypothetical protein
LQALPGVIFCAEIADTGIKVKPNAISNPLLRLLLRGIPKG